MMASATADANEFMAEANTTNLVAMWLQRPTGMEGPAVSHRQLFEKYKITWRTRHDSNV